MLFTEREFKVGYMNWCSESLQVVTLIQSLMILSTATVFVSEVMLCAAHIIIEFDVISDLFWLYPFLIIAYPFTFYLHIKKTFKKHVFLFFLQLQWKELQLSHTCWKIFNWFEWQNVKSVPISAIVPSPYLICQQSAITWPGIEHPKQTFLPPHRLLNWLFIFLPYPVYGPFDCPFPLYGLFDCPYSVNGLSVCGGCLIVFCPALLPLLNWRLEDPIKHAWKS